MSGNLDGTGTKLIATMEDNTKAFQFVQTADGDVYIFYEGTAQVERNGETTDVTALYEVNAETGETKLIASDVASYAFDRSGQRRQRGFHRDAVQDVFFHGDGNRRNQIQRALQLHRGRR